MAARRDDRNQGSEAGEFLPAVYLDGAKPRSLASPHEGEIEITQGLELPGKTDPDEIWREARRRMYEAIHRPDVYQATQHGSIRTATRDDKVMASQDGLDKFQRAARVVSVVGSLVELDERISMEAEASYSIRFRVFADEEDPVGVSVGRRASAPRTLGTQPTNPTITCL